MLRSRDAGSLARPSHPELESYTGISSRAFGIAGPKLPGKYRLDKGPNYIAEAVELLSDEVFCVVL